MIITADNVYIIMVCVSIVANFIAVVLGVLTGRVSKRDLTQVMSDVTKLKNLMLPEESTEQTDDTKPFLPIKDITSELTGFCMKCSDRVTKEDYLKLSEYVKGLSEYFGVEEK